MQPLVIYLLKANVVVTILFAFYLLMLKNDKSFTQNRFYLLACLVLSLLLPALPELNATSFVPIQRQLTTANPFNNLYATIGNTQTAATSAHIAPTEVEQTFRLPTVMNMLGFAYLLVVVVLLTRLIVKVFKVGILIKNTGKQYADGIYYCASTDSTPFSFFNYLVINKDAFKDSDVEQIIAHELVHIKQWHSIDVLFAEMMHAILWINPLLLHIKRSIKLNHEYIVDDEVISNGFDRKNYQLSILHSSLKLSNETQLTNLYNSSKIKLRIKMMNLKKSTNASAYKYAFVLLLVAASYVLINPLNANAVTNLNSSGMAKFEGFYELKGKKEAVIQITANGDNLVLKRLWMNKQFDFAAAGPLKFSTKEDESFTLQFSGDKEGRITQILSSGKDVWVKSNYHLPVEVKLAGQDFKKFEGYYELKGPQGMMIQITSNNDGLVLKELWSNKLVDFTASSPLAFFAKAIPGFTLQFTSDNAGKINEVLAFGKDVWVRSNYKPLPEIKLTAQELKKFEGKYEFKEKKGMFIQITSTGSGLTLKQSWDNKEVDFVASGKSEFFSKALLGFTLEFSDNKVMAFGSDEWDKVN